jgi:hypothetical protein
MSACSQEAVLLITKNVSGTATSVARERLVLTCTLPTGHEGSHRDDARNETWDPTSAVRPMLFRQEEPA